MITELLNAMAPALQEKNIQELNIDVSERVFRQIGLTLFMECQSLDECENFNPSKQRVLTVHTGGIDINIKPKS